MGKRACHITRPGLVCQRWLGKFHGLRPRRPLSEEDDESEGRVRLREDSRPEVPSQRIRRAERRGPGEFERQAVRSVGKCLVSMHLYLVPFLERASLRVRVVIRILSHVCQC